LGTTTLLGSSATYQSTNRLIVAGKLIMSGSPGQLGSILKSLSSGIQVPGELITLGYDEIDTAEALWNKGKITFGDDVHPLVLYGDYIQEGQAILNLRLSSTSAITDDLSIYGSAWLDGTLNVGVVGSLPDEGIWDPISATKGISGGVSTYQLPYPGDDEIWEVRIINADGGPGSLQLRLYEPV
jgi:hypothetical protein